MKENMPDISFERSMNHNYMILSKCSFFGKDDSKGMDYRTKMLLENHIPGLLPVTHRLMNGESQYYYEINSLQSLDRLYDKSEIRYDELNRLLSGCVNLFDRLEEYLLDGTQIIMKPDLIYIDVETMEPYFVCYPDYEGDVRLSFMEFIDELLTKIDHTDDRAVMLGYQVYRYTRNPNYVISEIGNMLGHVIVNMAHREVNSMQEAADLTRNDASLEGFTHGRPSPYYQSADKISVNDSVINQNHCSAYTYDEEEDVLSPENKTRQETRNIGDLIGGVFCVFVSLCSGAIILGARILRAFELSGNNELYLYGAMGMAIVAAVLFFSCYIKKGRQHQELDLLNQDEDCNDNQYYTSVESIKSTSWHYDSHPESFSKKIEKSDLNSYLKPIVNVNTDSYSKPKASVNPDNDSKPKTYNETVYLGDGIVEERMLCGRMNGKEVNISLDKLPMTVGKLADVSDFVIDDAAVSKMHARFEEHDGRVYLCDLNSTNGTVRNGVLLGVNQSVALEPGDRLRFG
ncbi:MAG: FHA domain-containing protein, partial [Lachnospiraceae bacterium]|nr:FHA domain-containing protein [Lachnospiraceae bacterium]